MNKLSSLLLIFLFCTVMKAFPLDFHFRHITSENGLPHQQVEALAQDADGNIWIGTRNGLSRYDGYDIRTYYHDNTQPTSLPSNFVNKLFVDSRNRLWIGTTAGLCRYRPATDDFAVYPVSGVSSIVENSRGMIFCGGNELIVYDEKSDKFTTLPSLAAEFIVSLAFDSNDKLYVATNHNVFYYNAALTKITYLDEGYYSDFLTGSDGIVPMAFDKKGRLWMGRNGKGAMRINFRTGEKRIFATGNTADGLVRAIAIDSQNRVWLSTEKGIVIVNTDDTEEVLQRQLSSVAVYTVLCDSRNNVWVGSYFGGVDFMSASSSQFSWWEPGAGTQNICGKVPRMMIETSPGIIWIATEDNGVCVLDMHSHMSVPFTAIPNLGTNVHSLYFDHATSDLWIGTFRNGLFRYNTVSRQTHHYDLPEGLPSNSIFTFAVQHKGRLWIGTTNGIRYYDPATDTFRKTGDAMLDTRFIYAICVDRHDNVWVGTTQDGLFRIDNRSGKVRRWVKDDGKGLPDNYVTCLYEDKAGHILIGTNNNGLHYFDAISGTIHPFGNEAAVSRSSVCSIHEDRSGKLWISTNSGLFFYSPCEKSFVCFTTNDGLPTNQFNFSSSLLASDGTMFFGTVDGLVSFNPEKVKVNGGPFRVFMKNLVINNDVVSTATPGSPLNDELDKMQEIHLSYKQAHSFCIEYGVIMPANAHSIEYQVRVDGIDKEWRNVGTEHRFFAYNMPSGTYKLRVRANNSNSGWENCPEKVLRIVVAPPFYRSSWAYLFYLLLLAGGVYAGWRIFSVRLKEKNEIKIANMEKEKVEEMDREKFDFFTTVSHELKTPLSLIVAPLKSIPRAELSEESKRNFDIAIKNTAKMERMVNELVTFNKVETNSFPFYIQYGNPLLFLATGLAPFHSVAAEKKISFSIDCEDNGEKVWFSPSYVEMIVDNLINNAMKFTPEGGSVSVTASITAAETSPCVFLHIEVADTGIGIEPGELDNIFNRYYQTKRGCNVNNSGWGLGLSLVKRLVNIHKGDIRVQSTPHKGSTFIVDLNVSAESFDDKCRLPDDKVIVPLSQYKFSFSAFDEPQDSSTAKTGEDVNKDTILIVDDNKDLLDFLSSHFARKYNVLTASDGVEALEIAHGKSVQLIVTDVMMPRMDGIELCRKIKSEMATSHIPVILLTAKSENSDVVAGYHSGAEGYVSKPFDPQALDFQIDNIMRLRRNVQKEIVDTGQENIEAVPISDIDKDFINRINQLVEDNIGNADFNIGDVTANIGVSRTLLHVKMKNLVNMSMGEYIRKKRLDKACQLLKQGYNVSETAYRTGFSDPSYFSKTFKKNIGVSPTEYV